MSAFNHVKSAKVRAYLESDKSTTLDTAFAMIDIAALAWEADERNPDIQGPWGTRMEAIEEARFALGQGDSVGVRIALRKFWLA
jgi:hypothetical protein